MLASMDMPACLPPMPAIRKCDLMSLQVRDIIDQNLFPGSRLVAGTSGLSAAITWVNIMEILDAPDSVQPGELLVSSGFGLNDKARFAGTIRRLKERGVSGLALQPCYFDRIPDYLRREAEDNGFPLLLLPRALTFSEILHKLLQRIQLPSVQTPQAHDSRTEALLFLSRLGDAPRKELLSETATRRSFCILIEPINYASEASAAWHKSLLQLRSVIMSDSVFFQYQILQGCSCILLVSYPADASAASRFYSLSIRLTLLSEQSGTNFFIGVEEICGQNDLAISLRHAEHAIDVLHEVKARRGLVTYSNAAFLKMFGALHQNDRSIVLENPALQALLNYDRTNQTDYVYTLRIYLADNCNATHASGHLFIHRHTLLKRLEKIQTLGHLDLDDYYTRVYMSLALLFHDYFIF